MKRLLMLGLVMAFTLSHGQEEGGRESDRLYQEGMNAYITGNYDQAILLAAQAVQTDPGSTRARDLLSVLVAEKERLSDSEVWLRPYKEPTPPSPVTVVRVNEGVTADLDPLWEEMRRIREEFESLRAEHTGKDLESLVRKMEGRVQVMASLIEKNSSERYEELRAEQGMVKGEITRTRSWGALFAIILFVVSLASLGMSFTALNRKHSSSHHKH